MTKIDKIDIQNINLLKKELKLKGVSTIKIKKGNYEIEISSKSKDDDKNIKQLDSKLSVASEKEEKTIVFLRNRYLCHSVSEWKKNN